MLSRQLQEEVENRRIQSTGQYIHDIAEFKTCFEVTASFHDACRTEIAVVFYQEDIIKRRGLYFPFLFKHYKIINYYLDK